MSHIQNERWFESKLESFEEAVESGDYTRCKQIIADVQEVSLEGGRVLNERLRNTPLEKFAIKSPIQPHDLA